MPFNPCCCVEILKALLLVSYVGIILHGMRWIMLILHEFVGEIEEIHSDLFPWGFLFIICEMIMIANYFLLYFGVLKNDKRKIHIWMGVSGLYWILLFCRTMTFIKDENGLLIFVPVFMLLILIFFIFVAIGYLRQQKYEKKYAKGDNVFTYNLIHKDYPNYPYFQNVPSSQKRMHEETKEINLQDIPTKKPEEVSLSDTTRKSHHYDETQC